ncbi:class F sortase [Sporichthya sp.]|uniref:class F sortase n=1 Tax=Sporichthya sp. TaxID=65475 RepID=UPI0017BCD42F|nr:class F sortase [Sporichthya sp.]MBA3745739.1 class F sortase [Sporichthya sp.]
MRGIAADRRTAIAAVLAASVVVIGACAFVVNSGDGAEQVVAAAPSATPTPEPTCSTTTKQFIPTSVSIPGVSKKISILPLPRDASSVPGTPPLTTLGKQSMAFDLGNGIRPGALKGNALLNAHTYPDGSALGNKLLDELEDGEQFQVAGPLGYMCYEVTDRREVPAGVYKPYFDKKGRPQIAIVVCSGERIGPGNWTKRTLWFASPVDSLAKA